MEYLTVSYRNACRSVVRSARYAILTSFVLAATSLQPTQAGTPIQDMVATYPSMADSIYNRFNVNIPHNKRASTGGYDIAPMPNQNSSAPRVVESTSPEVSPSMLGGKSNSYRGEGFVSGSSPQGIQQPKRMPMPGISLKVPLY